MTWTIYNEDAIKWAKEYEGEKFHALLTDAPYHLTSIVKRFGKNGSAPAKFGTDGVFTRSSRGFMNQQWDGGDIAFQPETWEAFKGVMHDGAFGMAFSASRNWHRMAVAIEDAGFVIHPTMFFLWINGQGFPKATKVKADGFDGYKYGLQALKPAVEPIIVFQKPYNGRPIDNIVETGAGVLNIDGARVPLEQGDEYQINMFDDGMKPFGNGAGHKYTSKEKPSGRYPANLILDEVSALVLDAQTGNIKAGVASANSGAMGYHGGRRGSTEEIGYRDNGGASRFFYTVSNQLDEADPFLYHKKVAPSERNTGLEDVEDSAMGMSGGARGAMSRGEEEYMQDSIGLNRVKKVKNPHPTLKPIGLAKYLATLLLSPAEYAPRRLFVPFSGVGSEMIGGCLAGWDKVIGVEFDKENGYVDIAEKRLEHWTK